MSSELNETTKDCGKNCLRKYDKVYKLYSNLEASILKSFCEDEGIDEDEFGKHAQQKLQGQMDQDFKFAAEQSLAGSSAAQAQRM